MIGHIRKAKIIDAKRILELFNEHPELTGDDSLNYNLDTILEYLSDKINNMFVYEIENKIIGIILVEFWKRAKYVYLVNLVVEKNYRRKGIAKLLIKHIEKLAKKEKMWLIFGYTEIKNHKMQKLFKKIKYKRGKKYYFYSKRI